MIDLQQVLRIITNNRSLLPVITTSFTPYVPPWYLRNGLVQTLATSYWYGKTWNRWRERVWWLKGYDPIPWQAKIFSGAENVPLWGLWACPPNARGTIILTYGVTGNIDRAWYSYLTAYKAYTQGWAVLLYDWRGHGKTAELSPVPSSDGWREGSDLVYLAEQLVALGCPKKVVLVGFSLGGQIVFWGLKSAQGTSLIQAGVTLCPNLESNRSLHHLLSDPFGRLIERSLTKELIIEAQRRAEYFPEAVPSGAVERINSIRSFDQEMVIDYYGFSSVTEYYEQTAGLYLLDQLTLPYLVIYAADDPIFDSSLVTDLKNRMSSNSYGHLLLTDYGGHVSHINQKNEVEDQFWGVNRILDFINQI